jgi:hypothetical protein
VKPRRHGRTRRILAGLAIACSLCAATVAAEEWHEAYRAGVSAQTRGDHAAAVERLRRAIALRPEPGRNVVTYGTNFEPRYYPYLRLAESLLALGQVDAAREALETSARWAREPAEERQRLMARVQAPTEHSAPSPSLPPPTAVPSLVPTAVPATAPPTANAPTGTAAPAVTHRTPTAAASKAPSTVAPTHADTTRGALDVISQPAGALVYIDDELAGTTDPQTGRLLKSDLAPGTHHVRLERDGHEPTAGDVDVPSAGRATFRATLPARPTPVAPSGGAAPSPAAMIAFAVVALALVAVIAWIALRRPSTGWSSIHIQTPKPGDASAVSTPPDLANPGVRRDASGQEWFGEYRLVSLLGRGGMASVYKAERHGETFALKRPLASFLGDPELLERFLREADIGRTLNHPNIVRVLDRGRVDGVPFMAMEMVPGETLQVFIRNWGAAEPRTAAMIVTQVAEALDFAHSKGVVHRDVKPSNIMLLLDATAKVMDFGIARSQRFDGLTTTGAFLGTPHYASPETIEGRGSDARSDLYSLGVVFYELLAGRKPYSADTPYSLLRKQVSEDAEPPSRFATVDPGLEAIVLRLLRRSPDERPAGAEELVVALREWMRG